MNVYTTIEESKQLIEAGLDVNTADMLYLCYAFTYTKDCYTDISYHLIFNQEKDFYTSINDELDLPCWSLAALIELLPDYIEYWNKEGYFYDAFLEISKHTVAYRYFDRYQYMKIQLFEAFNESLVSSVSTTIIWLLEHNYIKSNKNE